MTDIDGTFWTPSVELLWGSNVLEFRRLGYSPKHAELWTSTEDAELSVEIGLMPLALQMPEVVVEGERTIYHFGRMGGFIRRSRTGLGHYITRQDIEKSQPLIVTELLRRVPRVCCPRHPAETPFESSDRRPYKGAVHRKSSLTGSDSIL